MDENEAATMSGEQILIVDDELPVTRLCARVLEGAGYHVQAAASGAEALACLERQQFELLLVDFVMPGMDGLAVLRRIKELQPDVTAVVMTGYGTLQNAIDSLRAGARGFVLKPFAHDDLLAAVRDALEERQREQDSLRLRALLPILEVGHALLSEGDVPSLCGRLLETVVREVQADRAVLMLVDQESDELYVASALGLPAGVEGQVCMPAQHGIAARLLSHQEPMVLTGKVELEPPWPALLAQPGAAVACTPLHARQKATGVLCLVREEGRPPFTLSDLNLLAALGSQVATALDNAHLYGEIRSARDYSRTVLDSLNDQVIVLDRDRVVTDANEVFLNATGKRREDVIGQPCHLLHPGLGRPCGSREGTCLAAEVWRTGGPARGTHLRWDRAGRPTYVQVAASPLCDESGRVLQVIEAYRDVTAERQLQDTLTAIRALGRELVLLRDEEHIARAVVNAARRVLEFQVCELWLLDRERGCLVRQASTNADAEAEPASLPLHDAHSVVASVVCRGEAIYLPEVQDSSFAGTGFEGRSVLCVPLRVGDQVIGALNAESERAGTFGQDDGQIFATLADQAALALENAQLFAQIQRQMVERRRTEEYMLHTERLRAMGRLAAALAHEISNPLQAIASSVELVLDFPLEEEEQHQHLQAVRQEINRLMVLTNRILHFARPPTVERQLLSIHEVVDYTLHLARKQLQQSRIQVAVDLEEDLPAVFASRDHLAQVFLNLIINAVEFMPQGGKLDISARRAGEGVELAFADSGPGIPPDILPMIFEPFYTTKEDGTGLGLSISHSIIEQHQGTITARNHPGGGAVFCVTLPLAEDVRLRESRP
jgi:PAS domain S-box-containing protein